MRNRVEQLRRERGLNQEALARQLRVSRQTVSSIENGSTIPAGAGFFDRRSFRQTDRGGFSSGKERE